MKITNGNILNYLDKLDEAFKEEKRTLPVKVLFYVQKNKKLLISLQDEIMQMRDEIIHAFAEINENGEHFLPQDKFDIVNSKLEDLAKIEQEIEFSYINLDDVIDLELTPAQIESLMFMIKEE